MLTTMMVDPPRVESVVLACCCLHNLLRSRVPAGETLADGREDEGHQPTLPSLEASRYTTGPARGLRDLLKDYYNSPAGSVEWQDTMF